MSARILIAEDEWLIALALRLQLERLGYEVVGIARTGAEAVRLCPLTRPDVVLMDVQMPDMDGVTATRELMGECPHAIAIVTGRSALREAAEEAGAMCFVVKPLLDSQIPGLIEEASQRFSRYCAVRDEAGNCRTGLEVWRLVRRALRRLAEVEGLSEATAFASLQHHAATRGQSLRDAVEEVLIRPDGHPREQERGAA